MSKEETPITAEEWLKQRSIDNGSNHNWKDPSNDPRTSDLMEQYAQAKVLEALEREFSDVEILRGIGISRKGIDYYERKVKPNYE